MTAPLQLLALTFRLGADAESRLLAEIDRVEGRGALRVLDVMFLAKGQDGTVEELEVAEDEDFGSLLAPATGLASVQALAGSVDPGTAVAFLLVQHQWAEPLVDAVSAAGGVLISDDFLADDADVAVAAEVAATKGCTGASVQRTGIDVPAASMNQKALRLLNAVLSKPEDGAWPWIIPSARTVAGWLAANAAIFSGSGFPVLGSG